MVATRLRLNMFQRMIHDADASATKTALKQEKEKTSLIKHGKKWNWIRILVLITVIILFFATKAEFKWVYDYG